MKATRRLPSMTSTSTDRIEKRILLRAPRSRVWRALTDAREFGAWFRVALEGPFAEGTNVRGRITYPGYEHVTMGMLIERMDPERLFSYRWHPYAVSPDADYSRSEEHTSELQSRSDLVCRLLLEKKKKKTKQEYRSIISNFVFMKECE